MTTLLSIKNLTINVGPKTLVNDVSFEIPQGKMVAIAGGSGSGKTTIGLSILRLLSPALTIRQGSIIFEGRDMLAITPGEMQKCRGSRIGMVFQRKADTINGPVQAETFRDILHFNDLH